MVVAHEALNSCPIRGRRGWFNNTREVLQFTCSSPRTHTKVSRLVVNTCTRSPLIGSRLVDTAVRVDSWTGIALIVCVFMGVTVPLRSMGVHVQKKGERT